MAAAEKAAAAAKEEAAAAKAAAEAAAKAAAEEAAAAEAARAAAEARRAENAKRAAAAAEAALAREKAEAERLAEEEKLLEEEEARARNSAQFFGAIIGRAIPARNSARNSLTPPPRPAVLQAAAATAREAHNTLDAKLAAESGYRERAETGWEAAQQALDGVEAELQETRSKVATLEGKLSKEKEKTAKATLKEKNDKAERRGKDESKTLLERAQKAADAGQAREYRPLVCRGRVRGLCRFYKR